MIVQTLVKAIGEKWPFLEIKAKVPSQVAADLLRVHQIKVADEITDTIEILWPLDIINEMPNEQDVKIWIAYIFVTDDMIRLSIIKKKFCYENTLTDPKSLDELYTILSTHLADVAQILPEKYHVPQHIQEPTESELAARKMRAAMSLPTKLRVQQWSMDDQGTNIGIPENNDDRSI